MKLKEAAKGFQQLLDENPKLGDLEVSYYISFEPFYLGVRETEYKIRRNGEWLEVWKDDKVSKID